MRLLMVILLTLSLKCESVPLGTCKDLLIESENLGDSEQCDLYYECQPSGAVVKKLCDDGYVFHLHAARCVINVNIDCGNRTKLQPPVAPTKECPRLNGFFPFPDSNVCNKFYQCVKGKGDLKVCPATLVYDLKYRICLYPDQVNRTGCTDNDLIEAKCPKYDGKTPLQFGDHERFPTPNNDCRAFIICLENGAVRQSSCPHGKVYNTKTSSCDDPVNVPRCANYYPTTKAPKTTTTGRPVVIRKRPPLFGPRPRRPPFRRRPQNQPSEPKQNNIPGIKGQNRFRNRPQHPGFRRGPQFRPEEPEKRPAEEAVDNNVKKKQPEPQTPFRRRFSPVRKSSFRKPAQPKVPQTTEAEKPAPTRRSQFRRRRPGNRESFFSKRRQGQRKTATTTTTTTTQPPALPRVSKQPAIPIKEQTRARARLRTLFSKRRERRPIRLKPTTTSSTTEEPVTEIIEDVTEVDVLQS